MFEFPTPIIRVFTDELTLRCLELTHCDILCTCQVSILKVGILQFRSNELDTHENVGR